MVANADSMKDDGSEKAIESGQKTRITIELRSEDAKSVRDIAEELEITEEEFVLFSVRDYLKTPYFPIGREGTFRAIVNDINNGKLSDSIYLEAR